MLATSLKTRTMTKDTLQGRQQFTAIFLLLTVLFCICLIVSNLMEIKTVAFGPLVITAGFVVFPLSYIINDCIVEVYGFARARFVIWLGFAMNLLVTLFLQLGLWLPGSEEWGGQEAMSLVFGAVPRIFVASFIAFLCGSMVNAWVMSRMKAAQADGIRGSFSLRAIASTLFGEGVDSLIFFPVAFAGNLPWNVIVSLIVTQALLKTLYEIIVLPLTVRIVSVLKRREQLDVVDYSGSVSYKWWKVTSF